MENLGRIVDVDALLHNIKLLKNLKPSKKICAMIKADAYGHGIINIAKILDGHVDYLGVATIHEALSLRRSDIKSKILVVGKTEKKYVELACKNNISLSVFAYIEIAEIEQMLEEKKLKLDVHVKINTGMNRLGVSTLKEYKLIQNKLKKSKKLNFEGVFTHFCSIFDDNKLFFDQKKSFQKYINATLKSFNPICHIGGSGAINFDIDHVDMYRVGLNIYGYQHPKSNLALRKVLKIKSSVLQIHNLKKGEVVGYFPGVISPSTKKIATVFYGYNDGMDKKLKNRATVKICGQDCKIVAVCMDMIMVDVTGLDVKVGDPVVVFDDADKFAKILKSSNYEVLTGFSNLRVL